MIGAAVVHDDRRRTVAPQSRLVQVLTVPARRRPAMPPIVIAAALTIALAVAGNRLAGCCAPRDRTREQILANATQGLDAPTSPTRSTPTGRAPPPWARRSRHPGRAGRAGPPTGAGRPSAGVDDAPHPDWPRSSLPAGVAASSACCSSAPTRRRSRILLAGIVVVVGYFVPDLLLLQQGTGTPDRRSRLRTPRHARPDDHRRRGGPRFRVGDDARRHATAPVRSRRN